jgi:hypothetical protein
VLTRDPERLAGEELEDPCRPLDLGDALGPGLALLA